MQLLSIRRVVVALVAVGVLGPAAPAFAQPAVGSVGRADQKVPPGQVANDHDRGYRCDDNNGAGAGNPAHSACVSTVGEAT
jgi:hypothetical protein